MDEIGKNFLSSVVVLLLISSLASLPIKPVIGQIMSLPNCPEPLVLHPGETCVRFMAYTATSPTGTSIHSMLTASGSVASWVQPQILDFGMLSNGQSLEKSYTITVPQDQQPANYELVWKASCVLNNPETIAPIRCIPQDPPIIQITVTTPPPPTMTSTTTTVTLLPSSTITLGSGSITVLAQVTGSSGTPTGTVSFSDNGGGGIFIQTSCTLDQSGRCSVTYTSSAQGSVTINASYSGDQNNAKSSSGPAYLTVNPPPQQETPPQANNIDVKTNENTAVPLTLMGSDSDGDTITYFIVLNPSSGTLSGLDSAKGTVTYTPNTNFVGSDTFTFLVMDLHGKNSTATVTIATEKVDDTTAFPIGVVIFLSIIALVVYIIRKIKSKRRREPPRITWKPGKRHVEPPVHATLEIEGGLDS